MHQFFAENERLFSLEEVTEYDTATPYRYAVGKFVELAERIQHGQPVTVVSQTVPVISTELRTVAALMDWIARYFRGFDTFVAQRVNHG